MFDGLSWLDGLDNQHKELTERKDAQVLGNLT